ncbi:uncharacterized protein LOC128430562 [Pleuronectes platessa]|uniref:uncharacterized protein LOC128430562 n=1 Tax=Pleuronectes platessa TaxID=8262 RepID=UPI00232A43E2|nr:uncharacterized protein LOC128430562 [Pleuronectes platessa]
MASAAASPRGTCLLEKQLTCSICMDVFVDPVTTACGHTFCKKCLDFNCKYRNSECPLCRTFLMNTGAVNIVLREIIQQRQSEESEKNKKSIFTGQDGGVACDICTDQKLQAEKSCLVCLASYCSTHLQNHASTQRLKGHKLVAPVKNLDDRACLKHGRPLELYSKKQQRCICVRCLEEGPQEVVSTEDEWEKKKVELENAKTELEAKIQKRETQLVELSQSVKSCQDQLENEWWDIEAVFAAVLSIVEEAREEALQPLKDRREVVEKEAEDLQQDLEEEISRFQTTISELEDISTLEDHIHFLQNYPSLQNLDDIKDWAEVQLDTSLFFGTMRKTTAIMKEKVQQELEKLTSIELKRIPKFTVDVKLDPATAHQCLVLSEDGKEVKDGQEDAGVDDASERFDMFGSVLGLNGFTSGRSYWEVEVGNKPGWDLGVARGDANRKGKLTLNPDNGYWATVHYEDDQYAALTAPPLLLPLLLKPETVGVFVDYEEDIVSFYNITARSHIYSFTGCLFSGGELYPYFSPHRKQDDGSADPLIISSVKQREQIMVVSTLNTFDMSFQVCVCGWSKVTSYHGLRTHQGKMGCTQRGVRIPERNTMTFMPQITFKESPIYLNEPERNIFTWSAGSDESLQVCGCGWSKVTTYQGLRIHQGKMGCTEKGVRIPERKSYPPLIPFTGRPIQLTEPVMTSIESYDSDEYPLFCECGWMEMTYQGLRIHQGKKGCMQNGVRVPERRSYPRQTPPTGGPIQLSEPDNFIPPPIDHSPQTLNGHIHPAAAVITAAETREPFFQTPEPPPRHQTTTNTYRPRRALEFSTGAEQVEAQMFDLLKRHAGELLQLHPVNQITTPPMTAVPPREEEEEKQRKVEKLRMKAKQDNKRAELQQKIQMTELKMAEVELSVKGLTVSLDTEWLEINNVFSKMMKVVQDARQRSLQPVEERREKVKREGNDLLQGLKRETVKLQNSIAELDGNPDLQISPDEPTDWNNTSVDTSFSFGSLRTTTSAMMEQIQLHLEELSSVELKRFPTFAVDVKLDPATAHHCLSLSDDGKEVQDGGKYQEVHDTPERFDMFGSILGLNGLSSGRSYWEVEVGKKTGWDLGVARGDANRKGKLSLNPDNGYWATVHCEDDQYAALTDPRVRLSLRDKPQKVGVFVDYEEGLVSFYDTTARSHIHSFTECLFGGEIFPYFSPHLQEDGQNAAPLIISPVERQ